MIKSLIGKRGKKNTKRITIKVRKGKKMKKLISKWLRSEAYTEYCLNIARMYNYRSTL